MKYSEFLASLHTGDAVIVRYEQSSHKKYRVNRPDEVKIVKVCKNYFVIGDSRYSKKTGILLGGMGDTIMSKIHYTETEKV